MVFLALLHGCYVLGLFHYADDRMVPPIIAADFTGVRCGKIAADGTVAYFTAGIPYGSQKGIYLFLGTLQHKIGQAPGAFDADTRQFTELFCNLIKFSIH
jgi:hypothetical protein